jgi:hypothetical protein
MQQNLITKEQITSTFEAMGKVTKTVVSATGAGLPFQQALRMTTPEVAPNYWDYEFC